ncbi:MAG: hypothetical protein IKH28_00700 [Lachnospiraceae bacterium]|nr:hypothetical protein [Lachnospiraceae bacterium]
MDYLALSKDDGFQKWFDYQPKDLQISKYKNVDGKTIVTALKILDVYNAFSNARFSFLSAGQDDCGKLCEKNDAGKLFVKAHFLIVAIMEYNICWDLSMQVIWAYMHDKSYEELTKGDFLKFEKSCKGKTFEGKMSNAIKKGRSDLKKVKRLYEKYNKKTPVKDINKLCNYIKHNGTLYFTEFDDNFEKMYRSVNYKAINSLPRISYSFSDIEDKLFEFHNVFQRYFNKLIEMVIPSDYFDK